MGEPKNMRIISKLWQGINSFKTRIGRLATVSRNLTLQKISSGLDIDKRYSVSSFPETLHFLVRSTILYYSAAGLCSGQRFTYVINK